MSASMILLTRAACVLAVAMAWGGAAGGLAQAQAQMPKQSPAASEVRHADPQARKKRAALKKVQPSRKASSGRKSSLVRKHRPPGKSSLGAKAVTKKAPSSTRAGSAIIAAPPPVARALPPLGPERFYPNGIPELHPAFLHPLPGTPMVSEQAAVSRGAGAEPEWLP